MQTEANTQQQVHHALGIDSTRARDVRVLVMTGYGLNCEAETRAGFEMAGAQVCERHVSEVISAGRQAFTGFEIVACIGGFSFGDHIASGRVYANRLRGQLGDSLATFVDDGGLVIGICNGFQTLVKLGLLPGVGRKGPKLAPQTVSLAHNERLGYRNSWVRLRFATQSPCQWTRHLAGELLEMPSRHGEGKLVWGPEVGSAIEAGQLVPVRYVDHNNQPTESWPANPNGSPAGAAGLCDPSGRVFGIMPHPEAYIYPEAHPDWQRQRASGSLPSYGLGLRVLAGGVRAAYSG